MVDEFLTEGKLPTPDLPDNVIEIPDDVLSKSGSRAGTKWKEWFAQQPDGVECWRRQDVIKFRNDQKEKAQICFDINKQVQAHAAANALLCRDVVHRQPSYFTEIEGVPVRIRPDLVTTECVVDIKTSNENTRDHISRSSIDFYYDIQGALCRHVLDLPFVLIVIRSAPPYDIECVELSDEFLDHGMERALKALEGIREKRWRRKTHGIITIIDPPRWIQYQKEMELS